MPHQVFISHSSKDRLAVETIRLQLKASGVEPWLYEYDLRPGEHLATKLKSEIAASEAVVVLLTTQASGSPSVHQEVGVALGLDKPVIPLVEDGVGPEALAMLNGTEHVRFDPNRPQDALTELTASIQRRVTWAQGEQAATVTPQPSVPVTPVETAPRPATLDREVATVLVLVCVVLIIAVLASERR